MTGHRFLFGPLRTADEGILVLETRFGFIPGQLDAPDRPELAIFPNRILFMSTIAVEGVVRSAQAVYEPRLDSYCANAPGNLGATLNYFNVFGPERASVSIAIKPEAGVFQAVKRIDGSLVGTVIGRDWSEFFRNLTLLGLTKYEPWQWAKDHTGASADVGGR